MINQIGIKLSLEVEIPALIDNYDRIGNINLYRFTLFQIKKET